LSRIQAVLVYDQLFRGKGNINPPADRWRRAISREHPPLGSDAYITVVADYALTTTNDGVGVQDDFWCHIKPLGT